MGHIIVITTIIVISSIFLYRGMLKRNYNKKEALWVKVLAVALFIPITVFICLLGQAIGVKEWSLPIWAKIILVVIAFEGHCLLARLFYDNSYLEEMDRYDIYSTVFIAVITFIIMIVTPILIATIY